MSQCTTEFFFCAKFNRRHLKPAHMPPITGGIEACVRCKAQKQGGVKCRATHTEAEYPSTSLSQNHCMAVLKIRTTAFPHGELVKDQRLLETALREHGKDGVSAALAKLRGDAPLLDESAVVVDDRPDSEVSTDYEWDLREWEQSGCYEMKAVPIDMRTAARLLNTDRRYEKQIIDASVIPTRLTTTNCAVSHVSGAVNFANDLCPQITAWPMGDRIGR